MAFNDRFKFRRDEPSTETEEITTVDYPIETVEEEAPHNNVLMMAALGIAALAFVLLVVLLGSWAYHHSHKAKTGPITSRPPALSVTENGSGTGANATTGKSQTGMPQTGNSNSSKTSSTNGSPNGSANNPVSTGQLPNSGPGDVVALFVGTTILAAVTHFGLTRRRFTIKTFGE